MNHPAAKPAFVDKRQPSRDVIAEQINLAIRCPEAQMKPMRSQTISAAARKPGKTQLVRVLLREGRETRHRAVREGATHQLAARGVATRGPERCAARGHRDPRESRSLASPRPEGASR